MSVKGRECNIIFNTIVRSRKNRMKETAKRTYDFEVHQTSTYIVQGWGSSLLEAEQEAIERFHRLQKSGELVPHNVTKPKVIRISK